MSIRSARFVLALSSIGLTSSVGHALTRPCTESDGDRSGSGPGSPAFAAIEPMVHIPAATFTMGSLVGEPNERPTSEVHLTAYDLDTAEVTVGQYSACVRADACVAAPLSRDSSDPAHPTFWQECNGDRADRQERPANCVDWTMATAFCRWAGKRLPSEAEWEYAACGGTCAQTHATRIGTIRILITGEWPFMRAVASDPPNPLGIYGMNDNFWQWTSSRYCFYDEPSCEQPLRVVRGGSWSLVPFLRGLLTDRVGADPFTRNPNLGFRCARSAS